MIENSLKKMSTTIATVGDILDDLSMALVRLQENLDELEKETDKEFKLTFLLDELKQQIDNVNLSDLTESLDNIQDKIENLSYHYNRAFTAHKNTIYNSNNPFTPSYYKK
jgi:GH18 family chitinase